MNPGLYLRRRGALIPCRADAWFPGCRDRVLVEEWCNGWRGWVPGSRVVQVKAEKEG